MSDFVEAPILPGIATIANIVTPVEEAKLIWAVDGVALSSFKFQQWEGKRLPRSFGLKYDFQMGQLGQDDPLPVAVRPMRTRLSMVRSGL